MDSVNNRSLFRKKSQAARNKVREMGMVPQDRPQGILASFRELMDIAGRDRAQNLLPVSVQQMRPMQRPVNQGMVIAPPQPVKMQAGGPVTAPPPVDITQPVGPVDITQTPQAPAQPQVSSELPDISSMVEGNLREVPEAQDAYANVRRILADPEATEEEKQAALAEAMGVSNNEDGMRAIVEQVTGQPAPEGSSLASMSLDELDNAIMGVALGGAIGGPRSVAKRISDALLVGLQAKRQTSRERMAAAARAAGSTPTDPDTQWLETPQGEATLELYNDYVSGNYSHEDAIAELDRLSPGLGATLQRAMGQNRPMASAPATPQGTPQADPAQALEMARAAIEAGRDRAVIEQMLTDMGIDPSQL